MDQLVTAKLFLWNSNNPPCTIGLATQDYHTTANAFQWITVQFYNRETFPPQIICNNSIHYDAFYIVCMCTFKYLNKYIYLALYISILQPKVNGLNCVYIESLLTLMLLYILYHQQSCSLKCCWVMEKSCVEVDHSAINKRGLLLAWAKCRDIPHNT